VPKGAAVPDAGTPWEMERMLDSTPGTGYIGSVLWPACCGRLSTLIRESPDAEMLGAVEKETGPLDDALLAAETGASGVLRREHTAYQGWVETLALIRHGKHFGDGINLFQCRACGRVYGAQSEP
jgi:hypothetical protein